MTTDGSDRNEAPLTSEKVGKWRIIAQIDNIDPTAPIVNINKVQKLKPSLNDF